MKHANSKDKEKILKAARDKKSLTFMGRKIRLTEYISTDLTGQKGLAGYIHGPKSEEHAAKNTLSSKALIQNRRDKGLPNRQKLKEYVITKSALQEMLRGIL